MVDYLYPRQENARDNYFSIGKTRVAFCFDGHRSLGVIDNPVIQVSMLL